MCMNDDLLIRKDITPMTYMEQNKLSTEEVRERFALARGRIQEIASGCKDELSDSLADYFTKTAAFLEESACRYDMIKDGKPAEFSLAELRAENHTYFQDVMPAHYKYSYANPAYAVEILGHEFGRILSFLYTELRSVRAYIFEQNLFRITILYELFLEVYHMFACDDVTYRKLRDSIYWFLFDYAPEWVGGRVREMVDPDLDFALRIIMDSDLDDLRYLYLYGDFISDNELATARFLNSIPQARIDEIAGVFVEGYRQGFELKGVDLSKKKTVNIRYPIGFERVIRSAIHKFDELGLSPVIYRAALNTLNKNQNLRIGFCSTRANPQYDYDHRFDDAIYLDKRMVDRKLNCMETAYREYAREAAGHAGPAVFSVFGEEPFQPVSKPEAYRLSQRQMNLHVEYSSLANELVNRYIIQEERSFTIISYPIPAIGDGFEEIFKAIHKVNTLDNDRFRKIQQIMIDLLDGAEAVKIMGQGDNMTNLTIALSYLDDAETQTKFENCLADVNIPLGEVFTSPKLYGTEGLLHVQSVYLNGLYYENLRITFERGMVKDYSCSNFEDPEEGRRYIEENLLFNRETLPMGEFAIGTNTLAYVVSRKYDLGRKLPILIAEKTGPHIALGDTCYAYSEDVRVFNPDGKEMIARENECSVLRKTDPKQAYFNCHTDITIPYEDIGRLVALTADRVEKPIIMNGRFVLEGTLELNLPLDEAEDSEFF